MSRLKSVAIIPSLFTLGNAVCGFASIIVASRIQTSVLLRGEGPGYDEAMYLLYIAGLLIFGGMIFDVLDGRMARLANSASKFGAELDSLCDVVTFGAAPAFLLLKLGPTANNPILYKVLFVAATFFVICTILRLARFNVETTPDDASHRYFKGLPSPAAAGCIASVAVARYDLQTFPSIVDMPLIARITSTVLPFLAIGLALLMVSTLTYVHLVNQSLRGRRPFSHLVQILVVVIGVLVAREMALLLAFWGFAAIGPIRHLLKGRAPASVKDAASPQAH